MYYSDYKRKRRMLWYVIVSTVTAAVILLWTSIYFLSKAPILPLSAPTAVSEDSLQGTAILYEQPEEWIPELPVRLVIPTIGVDAVVQYVGLSPSSTGEMGVPSNFTDVGWYEPGIRPGMKGSAVIAGHYNGRKVPQAVFYDLQALDVGDEVVIMSAERIEDIFYVVKVETYNHDAPTTDVFVSTDGKARLNLITCAGDWLADEKVYNKRTVVFTERMTDVE